MGPTTSNGEYASIIRMRSLRRLWLGLSSALNMDVCDTFISRAAWARFFPAFFRKYLARAVIFFSVSDSVINTGGFLANISNLAILFSCSPPVFLI